jgi:hypothetical protein
MHFLPVANTRVINGKDWIQIQLIKIPSLRPSSEGWDFLYIDNSAAIIFNSSFVALLESIKKQYR